MATIENEVYWAVRFLNLDKALQRKGLEFYALVQKAYDRALRDIKADLRAWYKRFAVNENISLTEAKRLLNSNELAEFRMTLEEYIAKGSSCDPRWAKALERASIKVHITRLEALKLQMQHHAEELTGKLAFNFTQFGVDTYSQQYYRAAFLIQRGLGVGWDLMKLNTTKVRKTISKPWTNDGREFSDRIWRNRTKLVDTLHTTLTSALARGETPAKTIKQLSSKMDVSAYNAGRLIMTESAFFASTARQDCFEDLEVERYKFVCTLDETTCPICQEADGKVFTMSAFTAGTNAPPLHPWCRCVTVPYIADYEGFRAARTREGGYTTLPDKITYQEWYKRFVTTKKD